MLDVGCSQEWADVVHTSGPVCAQNAELFHSVLEVAPGLVCVVDQMLAMLHYSLNF